MQESNNITVSDIEIKVEKFEESPSVNNLSAQLISKESPADENFSLKDCPFVKQETGVFKTEEDDIFYKITESKFNEGEVKDEYFDVPESIAYKDIVIKTEDLEEDQSNSKYFDPDDEEARKTFTCSFCFTGLSTEQYKNSHERRCKFRKKEQHLGGSVFECSNCKLLFTREEDKNTHQAVCKKRKQSKKCEESTTKRGEKKYCCDKCSYETKHKSHLVGHIQIHDKVNALKYTCNQCPYQTINKSNLRTHLRIHNCFGLICVVCQKSFKRKLSLDAHYVSRHPDRSDKWESTITSKINECPTCLYKTIYITNFKDHLMTHEASENQAQHKCEICGYQCASKRNFVTHLRLHVDQLPFVCTGCDKRFNRKSQLDGHIIARHSDNEELVSSVTSKVHQCDKCNFKTTKNINLKKHLHICLQRSL